MPKDSSIKKVLVIGSGPIVIGQAAEFDYAGAQACRVLRDEGINIVLVNSNPATIMTDNYLRFMENYIRKTIDFTGTPIKIVLKNKMENSDLPFEKESKR